MNRFLLLPLFLVGGGLLGQMKVCTVTPAGETCANLDVTLVPQGHGGAHDLTLRASGLHPNALGALNWGVTPLNVTLPGGGCLLLCDSIWSRTFQTDDLGNYEWSRAWGAGIYGTFYLQMGSIQTLPNGQFEVRTTSCKMAMCSMV